MKIRVQKVGKFITDRTVEHNVSNSTKNCLIYLERFLVYLAEHKGGILQDFIARLKAKIESEIQNSFDYSSSFDLPSFKNQLSLVQDFPELIKACINLHLSLLKVPKNYHWEPQVLTLLHLDTDKASLYPRYFLAKVLTEVMVREEAIQLFKDYIDYSIFTYLKRPRSENLTQVFENDVKNGKTCDFSIYVSALVNEGLYAGRVDKCMGYEALKELNDPELAELVTCYGDFSKVKKGNEHFVLTRSCTLHTGPYCDNLYHDTRIIKEVKHLPRDFFDNLRVETK